MAPALDDRWEIRGDSRGRMVVGHDRVLDRVAHLLLLDPPADTLERGRLLRALRGAVGVQGDRVAPVLDAGTRQGQYFLALGPPVVDLLETRPRAGADIASLGLAALQGLDELRGAGKYPLALEPGLLPVDGAGLPLVLPGGQPGGLPAAAAVGRLLLALQPPARGELARIAGQAVDGQVDAPALRERLTALRDSAILDTEDLDASRLVPTHGSSEGVETQEAPDDPSLTRDLDARHLDPARLAAARGEEPAPSSETTTVLSLLREPTETVTSRPGSGGWGRTALVALTAALVVLLVGLLVRVIGGSTLAMATPSWQLTAYDGQRSGSDGVALLPWMLAALIAPVLAGVLHRVHLHRLDQGTRP